MGEKGIASGLDVAGLSTGATDSLIERTTVTATTTVVGAGHDVVDAIRDKAIGAVADDVVDAARDTLKKDTPEPPPPPGA